MFSRFLILHSYPLCVWGRGYDPSYKKRHLSTTYALLYYLFEHNTYNIKAQSHAKYCDLKS